ADGERRRDPLALLAQQRLADDYRGPERGLAPLPPAHHDLEPRVVEVDLPLGGMQVRKLDLAALNLRQGARGPWRLLRPAQRLSPRCSSPRSPCRRGSSTRSPRAVPPPQAWLPVARTRTPGARCTSRPDRGGSPSPGTRCPRPASWDG